MKMNLCRACLCTDKELFPSDDEFACNYNLLTNINVKYYDGKPQCFCQNCIEAVNSFIVFRNKCVSAESSLLGLLKEAVKTETETIKIEVKAEEEDFGPETLLEDDHHDYTEDTDFKIKEECDETQEKQPKRQSNKKKPKNTKKTRKEKCERKTAPFTGTVIITSSKPTCGLCNKRFPDGVSLSKHIESHDLIRGCQLCSANFDHQAKLFAHRLEHTAHNKTCHLCSKRYHTSSSLELHYRKLHFGEENAMVECSLCHKKFISTKKLSKHTCCCHSKNVYTCDICSKKFNNKSNLRSHMKGHSDEKPYACELCGYRTKFISGLTAHNTRRHSQSKCICKYCGNAFANAERLAKHCCSDRSEICPVCGKNVRRGLQRHMRTHSAERLFKCSRCPAAYKCSSALKEHIDKHDNNPKQQCEYCSARFYSASVLIKHRRRHTGEKPYACTKCDMRFTGGNNLKVHMKVHGEHLVVKKNQELDADSSGASLANLASIKSNASVDIID